MDQRFSIVVNTNGRRESLGKTLESFRWLQYENFEVCVVCGPTMDGSREFVRDLAERGHVKFAECDEFNLSASRNIGIRVASGDVVAFIDDDAVPEPKWLSELAPCFNDATVGGAGGVTYDHTGHAFQARFILCDRFGDAQLFPEDPGVDDHNYPFSHRYPSLMGTNSTFRRSSLISIGGFDEEFDYYLDETDVCSRIVDLGQRIIELPNAAVHHKFLPSHLRNEHRFLSTPFPVLKNKAYFAFSNSPRHHTADEAIRNIQSFFEIRRNDILWGIENGRVSHEALDQFAEQADRAWQIGLARALENRRRIRPAEWFGPGAPFLPFPSLRPEGGQKTFAFLSQNYPPGEMGGNARHTSDIARAIAQTGHNVHVLTRGQNFNRVDFEDGVWVHRIVPRIFPAPPQVGGKEIPSAIWNYSATMLDEALRLDRSHPITAIEGVSWDCEPAAFVFDGRFPVVTNVVTNLPVWLETHPEQAGDRRWMKEFGQPMMSLESELYKRSDRVLAASQAILDSLLGQGAELSADRTTLCPHGLEDMRALPESAPDVLMQTTTDRLCVLFVGRLELRKGIDTLLDAALQLLADRNDLQFWIVGDNSIALAGGASAQADFLARPDGTASSDAVQFLGPVSDAELRWLYHHCDLFVAPSRFESFGLIYVEAMMFAKPVIGCRTGGVGEVVVDGETGLLTPPGDSIALSQAIARLADDADLRRQLGEAGRARYERQFAAPLIAERRIRILSEAARPQFIKPQAGSGFSDTGQEPPTSAPRRGAAQR